MYGGTCARRVSSGRTVASRWTHLGLPVAQHHHAQRRHVQHRKQLLRQQDVLALVGEVVQPGISVDVCARVHQRSGAALDLGVVPLAGDELRDLLHVGSPVDLGI